MLKFRIKYGKTLYGNPKTHTVKVETRKQGLLYVLRYFTKFGAKAEDANARTIDFEGDKKSSYYTKKLSVMEQKTEEEILAEIQKQRKDLVRVSVAPVEELVVRSTNSKKK